VYLVGDIVATGVVVAEVLALEIHPHADKGVLLLAAALPELLFLVRFVGAWPGHSWPLPFFWSSTRVRVLLFIFSSFDFLALG
jgi:hypothetical protein